MARGDLSGPEPQPLHRPRPEVLDHDIGAREQRVEDRPRAGGLEGRRQTLLVAVDAEEVRALAPDEGRSPRARVVPSARLLDLDDARAEIRELHRAVGAREDTREVEDEEAVKGGHGIWKFGNVEMWRG